jgi:hypothetical protein
MLSIHSSQAETGRGRQKGGFAATKTARRAAQRPLRAEICYLAW